MVLAFHGTAKSPAAHFVGAKTTGGIREELKGSRKFPHAHTDLIEVTPFHPNIPSLTL